MATSRRLMAKIGTSILFEKATHYRARTKRRVQRTGQAIVDLDVVAAVLGKSVP